MMELKGYQQNALDVFTKHIYSYALFEWPRRSGKTLTALRLMKEWLKDGGRYAYCINHSPLVFKELYKDEIDFSLFDLVTLCKRQLNGGYDGVIIDDQQIGYCLQSYQEKLDCPKVASFLTPSGNQFHNFNAKYMANKPNAFYQSLTIYETDQEDYLNNEDLLQLSDKAIAQDYFCYKYFDKITHS